MKKKYLSLLIIISLFIANGNLAAQQLDLDWQNTTAGQQADAKNTGLVTDVSGNVYVIGEYSADTITFGEITLQNISAGEFPSNSYGQETNGIYIVKYNDSGNVLWAKTFGSDKGDFAQDITIDTQGNIYIVGTFMGTNISFDNIVLSNTFGHESIFVAKINTNGSVLWAKSAQGVYKGTVGTTGLHYTYAGGIAVTSQGNVYIGGRFTGSLAFDGVTLTTVNTNAGGFKNSFFLIKYNQNGEAVLAKQNEAQFGSSRIFDISVDSLDNVYIGGTYSQHNTEAGQYNMIIDGITLPIVNPESTDVTGFIAKFNSDDVIQWAKNTIPAYFLKGGYNNNVVVIQQVYYPQYNIVLNNYNANGDVLWSKLISNNQGTTFYALDIDAGNNIVMSGQFEGNSFTLDDITMQNTSQPGYRSEFLAKISNTGQTVWAFPFKGYKALGLAGNSQGNIYLAGQLFQYDGIFGEYNPDLFGVYTARLSGDSIPLSYNTTLQQLQSELLVYPNPVENILNIKTSEDDVYSFAIYNALGQAVINKVNQNQNNISINMSQLQAGYYMLEVNKKSGRSSHKIIKK